MKTNILIAATLALSTLCPTFTKHVLAESTGTAYWELSPLKDQRLGFEMLVPNGWKTDADNEREGRRAFCEVKPAIGSTAASLAMRMEDMQSGAARVNVTAPVHAEPAGGKIFTVASQPARLTVNNVKGTGLEAACVQIAKGSRFYTLDLMYPAGEHARYLALADQICTSLKLE